MKNTKKLRKGDKIWLYPRFIHSATSDVLYTCDDNSIIHIEDVMKVEHREIFWEIGDRGFIDKETYFGTGTSFEVIGVHHSWLWVKLENGLIKTYTNEETKTFIKERS